MTAVPSIGQTHSSDRPDCVDVPLDPPNVDPSTAGPPEVGPPVLGPPAVGPPAVLTIALVEPVEEPVGVAFTSLEPQRGQLSDAQGTPIG